MSAADVSAKATVTDLVDATQGYVVQSLNVKSLLQKEFYVCQ